jgi:hypothetical protein
VRRIKNILRLWLAGVSLGGFLGGWVLLAHAPKPASSSSSSSSNAVVAPLPTLTPLPPLNANVGGDQFVQPAPSLPSIRSRAFVPMLKTGGS